MRTSKGTILLLEEFALDHILRLQNEGYVLVRPSDPFNPDHVVALMSKVSELVPGEVMAQFKSLRYVLVPATSPDLIDQEYIQKHGIRLITLREQNSPVVEFRSTTEIVIWHLISLMRNAFRAATSVSCGEWDRNLFHGYNLSGARIGIVGLGRLGMQVANICKELNMKVYAFDQRQVDSYPEHVQIVQSLESLIVSVDVLTIHVNDKRENYHLISEAVLSLASDLFLINTSRGHIVDESALLSSIRSGKVLGYAADTIKGEGMAGGWLRESELWRAMTSEKLNIIMTPHIGGATFENVYTSEQFVIDLFLHLDKELS
jgi:D-3-phosphoglycerate dehydrogenase